jgi:membrane protease subunit HflK
VYGGMDKVILDGVTGGEGGTGVLPYLPLDRIGRGTSAPAAGGTN